MSDQLRICIVTDAWLPGIGGIENHVLHLSAELVRLGHEVTVVTHRLSRYAPGIVSQVTSPVPVVRMPGMLLMFKDHDIAVDPGMLREFRHLLERREFDIVHGQSEGSLLVFGALALARRQGLPTVLTRHSMLAMKPPLVRPLLKGLVRGLLGSADGVVAVSEACAREIRLKRQATRVIPNGVDIEAFRPLPEARQRVRSELGLGAEDIVIGNIGRLHVNKGILMLLDVFEQIRGQNPRLKLLLAGPGPLRARIADRTRAYSQQVRLLEPLPYDRVPSVLNAIDVFALASFGEAFGISLLEAMACGVPGIALDRWGVRDLVVSGKTGYLVPDAGEFRMRLEALSADAGLRRRMGQAARVRAERFSWQGVTEQTVSFYRELMAKKAAGGWCPVAGSSAPGREPVLPQSFVDRPGRVKMTLREHDFINREGPAGIFAFQD
jgi:glycosyltransferase involved in cell wall biosynthesis